jgi:hypothetical protein
MTKTKITTAAAAATMLGLVLFAGACEKKNEGESSQSPPAVAPSPAPESTTPPESAAPPATGSEQGAAPAPEKPADETKKSSTP